MKTILYFFYLSYVLFLDPIHALATSAPSHSSSVSAWENSRTEVKVTVIAISSVTALFGLILGWVIFPLTIAPITYLMQSELMIWSSRLGLALGGGVCGFIFPFQYLLKYLS